MMDDKTIHVPVLIVGAGPTGVICANLLGVYGIETLIIDRSPTIFDFPRAAGLDDEAMRTIQAAGLAREMLRDMVQNVPMRLYSAKKKCMAEILPGTREFGWYRRNLFSQPLGEVTLRKGLERFPHVTLSLSMTLQDLSQDSTGVTAKILNESGQETTVRADYVIGSDGASSKIRDAFLKISNDGKTHPRKWVVIECDDDPLNAPYTALHCEPQRPYVCLKLPYGLRRWEFMLFEDEDDQEILQPEKVHELLRHHIPDPSGINIIRARVYKHHSRIAQNMVSGRVCLVGDAAHLTPPWIGQGLNAGIRDAFNVSWKIAWILKGRLKPEMLQSYHQERHTHAKAMIELADLFGATLSVRNPILAWLRDRILLSVQNFSSIRNFILQMKFKPMPALDIGIVLPTDKPKSKKFIGRMFIQPDVVGSDGTVVKLDELVGPRFCLIMWNKALSETEKSKLSQQLDSIECITLAAAGAKSAEVSRIKAKMPKGTALIEDYTYDLQIWFNQTDTDWVLVRPDRYIAALGKFDDLEKTIQSFHTTFSPISSPQHEKAVPSAA
jgi:3-(3-hydroxy-phenyl)propionate hydroxylase